MRGSKRAMEWLRKHDAPCPSCGYNLRGNTTSRCPECGTEFDPVDLCAPRMPRTFAGTVSHPDLLYVVMAVNVLALIVNYARGMEQGQSVNEGMTVVALVVLCAAWSSARHNWEGDGDLLGSLESLGRLLVDFIGLGLGRIPSAAVFVPVLTLLLTLKHIATALAAR